MWRERVPERGEHDRSRLRRSPRRGEASRVWRSGSGGPEKRPATMASRVRSGSGGPERRPATMARGVCWGVGRWRCGSTVALLALVAVVAVRPARADDDTKSTFRAVIDRVELEPSILGGQRL